MSLQKITSRFLYDDTGQTIIGYRERDRSETFFVFSAVAQSTFMQIGSPFLYSNSTGKIVGVKNPNGTESFFTMGSGPLSNNVSIQPGTPFLYDNITRRLVGFLDGGALSFVTVQAAFMQAQPVGFIGSFRTVAGHNSVSMYRAAADMDTVEVAVSNAILFASQNTSEAFPSDSLSLQVKCVLWAPTFPYVKTVRAFASPLSAGATSGTLAANAPGSTLEYVQLNSGEYRWMRYTGGSTNVTWDAPLTLPAAVNAQIWQMQNKGIFTFDGSGLAVLTGGQFSVMKSSIAGLAIKKNDPVYVTSYISRVGGGNFLLPGNQPANGTDALNNGLLESYTDGAADNTGTRFGSAPWYTIAMGANQFRPIALRGLNLSNNTSKPVTVIGDSIASNPVSWVQQFLHSKTVPYVNLSKAGETAAQFISSSAVRVQVLGGGVALVEMGRNAWALPGMQALWSFLRTNYGYTKIIQVLPPPQTTSGTSDWSSEATQNPDTATLGVNAQIIALLGQSNGPDVIWDTYTPCMGTDNQKWAAGYTGDGTHPGALGIAAIIAYANSNNWINDLAV
jgi:hypothetical protein